jgi:hypothetical protein
MRTTWRWAVRRSVTKTLRGIAVATLSLMWLGLVAGRAGAHEQRTVGDFDFVVGFGNEPAFAGFQNSVELFVSRTNTEEPVEGVAGSLGVEVVFGDAAMEMALEPAFGSPGEYHAFFIPTRPGAYTFHFTGDVEGLEVDEEFTSSPTGFAEVEEPSAVQFPVQDPSTAEVGQRLDQEIPRLTERLDATDEEVSGARTLSLMGVAIGAVALVVGAGALLARRKES